MFDTKTGKGDEPRILYVLMAFSLTAIFLIFLNAHPVLSADEPTGGVKKGGVIFNIAADRKVEKIGGVVQPEPLDQYLGRLFAALSEQIQEVDTKVVRIQAELDEIKKAAKETE